MSLDDKFRDDKRTFGRNMELTAYSFNPSGDNICSTNVDDKSGNWLTSWITICFKEDKKDRVSEERIWQDNIWLEIKETKTIWFSGPFIELWGRICGGGRKTGRKIIVIILYESYKQRTHRPRSLLKHKRNFETITPLIWVDRKTERRSSRKIWLFSNPYLIKDYNFEQMAYPILQGLTQ